MKRCSNKISRFLRLLAIFLTVSLAVATLIYKSRDRINYFYTPEQLLQQLELNKISPNKIVKVGGVVEGYEMKVVNLVSSHKNDHSTTTQAKKFVHLFSLKGKEKSAKVKYVGQLPSLFREGQTIIVSGKAQNDGVIRAFQVLAKHDEKYTPVQTQQSN